METKTFNTLDLLSITTGRHVSSEFSNVYEILGWMMGCDLWTHELPAASDICKPHLIKLFPELVLTLAAGKALDKWLKHAPTCPEEAVKMWFTEQKMMFPEIKDEYEVPCIQRERTQNAALPS